MRPLQAEPVADEAGQLADQESCGDGDRHERRREQKSIGTSTSWSADRPTGDLELDLCRDRIARDEAETSSSDGGDPRG